MSLFRVCGKIFEKIIFNLLFKHLDHNHLLNGNQSGFHPGDSCTTVMYKLKLLGICGKYYRLIHSFLNDRHQRVVLNGQRSNWSKIIAGIPQGSILGPLFFLVYINNL